MQTAVKWWQTPLAHKVGLGLIILAIAGTVGWYFLFYPYVATDDARVDMTLVRVAPSGVSGRVTAINVTEGSVVKKGDVLVELDHRVPQALLEKAQAKEQLAKKDLDRAVQLYKQRTIPSRTVDDARSKYAVAQAELSEAQVHLENTFLRSPFDGVVVQKQTEIGNILQSSQTAVTVADDAHAWIAANIEETSVGDVKIGQPVSISIDAGGELNGTVSEIRYATANEFALIPSDNGAGNFTKVVQRIPIKIKLEPGHPPLRDGQSVEIKIRVH